MLWVLSALFRDIEQRLRVNDLRQLLDQNDYLFYHKAIQSRIIITKFNRLKIIHFNYSKLLNVYISAQSLNLKDI